MSRRRTFFTFSSVQTYSPLIKLAQNLASERSMFDTPFFYENEKFSPSFRGNLTSQGDSGDAVHWDKAFKATSLTNSNYNSFKSIGPS